MQTPALAGPGYGRGLLLKVIQMNHEDITQVRRWVREKKLNWANELVRDRLGVRHDQAKRFIETLYEK